MVTVARLTTDEDRCGRSRKPARAQRQLQLAGDQHDGAPYAVYRLRADASGWQKRILTACRVFDGQQTVARLIFARRRGRKRSARTGSRAPDRHHPTPGACFAGDGGSGPAPEERLPGDVLSEVVVPLQNHRASTARRQAPVT